MRVAGDNPPRLHSTLPVQRPWQSTKGHIPTTPPGVSKPEPSLAVERVAMRLPTHSYIGLIIAFRTS